MAVSIHNRIKKRMTDVVAGYTLKAMLLNGYVDNPDHNFVSDLVASEISTTGYARATLGSLTSTQDDTNNRSALDSADIAFGAVGVAAGVAVTKLAVFRNVTVDADHEIVAVYDCAISLNGGTLTITIHANGLLTVS